MNKWDRGWKIERELGGWCNNFPTIDKGVKRYVGKMIYLSDIVSIKSLDTTTKSYKNVFKLRYTLKKYIDDLAGFEGKKNYKGFEYIVEEGTDRTLQIAVPPVEMTAEQAKVFDDMMKYAKEEYGIDVVITIYNKQ